ncbi:MAG: O-antigen ligase family protein [Elusimicrobiales bacterium]|nr:O-antigen ligase family protein [Elusimicrobiales bacterium]
MIKEKTIINILIGLFIPISVIALLQHFTNSSILPVKSADGYFEVLVYNFYNNMRAFSMFAVSLGLAFFSCIISLMFCLFYMKTKKKHYLLLLLISIFVVIITYSRTGYLILFFSLLTFIIYRVYKKVIRLIPLIYFFLSFMLILGFYYYGKHNVNEIMVAQYKSHIIETSKAIKSKIYNQLISDNYTIYSPKIEELEFSKLNSYSKSPITAPDSFFMRIVNWQIFPKSLLDTPLNIIFGAGIYSSKYFSDIRDFCIDNIYVDTLIHIGLLGFLIYFWFLYEIYLFVCNNSNNSILLKVSMFLMATIPISGFFAGMVFVYFNFILISFFVLDSYEKQNIY